MTTKRRNIDGGFKFEIVKIVSKALISGGTSSQRTAKF
jgi:hypothetical protein